MTNTSPSLNPVFCTRLRFQLSQVFIVVWSPGLFLLVTPTYPFTFRPCLRPSVVPSVSRSSTIQLIRLISFPDRRAHRVIETCAANRFSTSIDDVFRLFRLPGMHSEYYTYRLVFPASIDCVQVSILILTSQSHRSVHETTVESNKWLFHQRNASFLPMFNVILCIPPFYQWWKSLFLSLRTT